MGRHQKTAVSQGNTMEQCTMPVPLPQRQTPVGGAGDALSTAVTVEEPSQAKLLAAIQGSRVALEERIETVAVECRFFHPETLADTPFQTPTPPLPPQPQEEEGAWKCLHGFLLRKEALNAQNDYEELQ
ncbi:hypothetical protein NDU88_007772 [Pleurodeles waltl]|uniref:Uncharacterized protein n=1 Tax=Pleurodeles waltl TaxID=8319 RepID=A0AAV7ST98_PLEWA|nr:hypothetical protein NDU88_007772 [Pleurodeles waltl]